MKPITHYLGASASTLVLAMAAPALAAPATVAAASSGSGAEAPTALEEVVVTAQRRSQNLQDVGISVAAFSGEVLKASGAETSMDVARLTPGVHLSGSIGGQSANFTVRGVTQNDFNDAIEAPVAVYVDEGYVPSLQGQAFGIFDVERVEVLKGPQGTLFGRNATGGLVHYVVKKPTDTPEGSFDLTYGRFNQVKAEGALSGPIAQGVSGRASFYFNRHDDIWRNVYPKGLAGGAPSGVGGALSPCCQNEWNDNTLAGRLQLKFEPTNDLTIRLVGSAARQHLSTGPYTSVPVVPVVDAQGRVVNSVYAGSNDTRTAIGPNGANYAGLPNSPPSRLAGRDWLGFLPPSAKDLEVSKDFALGDLNRTESYNAALHFDYRIGDVDLVGISDFKEFSKNFSMDVDASPINLVDYGVRSKTRSFSQELRASGHTERLQWVAGAYFLDIDAHVENGFLAPPNSIFSALFNATQSGIDLINVYSLKTISYSGFGQIEYKFAPRLSLILGGRIIEEKQTYNFVSNAYANVNDYRVDTDTALFPLQPAFHDKRSKTMWAGKAQLEFRPNRDLLLYAGVNRGVKGGAYNAKLPDGGPPLPPSAIPYDPEVLVSYETGFKSTLADGRVYFNASAFYYNYSKYQAFTFSNVSGYVQNRDARNYGAEIDVSARPADGVQVTLGASFFNAKVKNVEIAPGVFRDVKPTFAPETQISAQVSYRLPFDVAGGALTLHADGNYSSSFYHNIRNFDSTKLDGYALFNARASWLSADGRINLSAAVTNLLDKRYPSIGYELSTLCGCNEQAYGRPRWFSLTVGYSF